MDTPPTWSVRPLGLQAIASEALACRGRVDATLRQQLAAEVISSASLTRFLARIPEPPSGPPTENSEWRKNWQKEWIAWFETVIRQYDPAEIVSDIGGAIASALSSRNWYQAAFLIRRLAAELGQHNWSRVQLFGVAKRKFCDSPTPNTDPFDPDRFQQEIIATFVPSVQVSFLVHIPLASAVVSRDILKRFKRRKLIADQAANGEWMLRAVEMNVDAVHSEEAAAIARASVRDVIERLRLRYYVRTGAAGDATVTRLENGAIFNGPMPQPFWSSSQFFRRDIPRLPRNYSLLVSKLPDDECSRWRAAQWHLSQAIATWGEDTHTAASEIWQALEAFAGVRESGWKGVLDFVLPYARLSVLEMAQHVAVGVRQQARQIKALGQPCDWFSWYAGNGPVDLWFKKVADPKSRSCCRNWGAPPVPPLLSDASVGILAEIAQELRHKTRASWVEKRLVSDLRLLYALRNKVVHRGERIFGERAATYLGQVGMELLFGVMQLRRDSVISET